MSLNRVTLSGNLTREPELRTFDSGSCVLNFGIAVNDRRKNQQGEWEDVPNFVNCSIFGKRAEALSKILTKGMKVALEGKLRYHAWEQDGQKRSALDVVVQELELMQQKGTTQQTSTQTPARSYNASVPPKVDDVYDEDIPF